MPEYPDYDQEPSHPGFRDREALTFLLKEIQRKFPDSSRRQIHDALEQAILDITPSLDRGRLRKRMMEILRDKGNPPKETPSGE